MITAFIDHLKQAGLRPRTVGSIRSHLTCFLRWCEAENLDGREAVYRDLLTWVQHQQEQGLTAATINMRLRSLERWYSWLDRQPNPAYDLQVRSRQAQPLPEILSPQQLEELHRHYFHYSRRLPSRRRRLCAHRNLVLLGFMIYQGLQSGELAILETEDVNLTEGSIYVPEGSRWNARSLPLQSGQLLILETYLEETRPQLQERKPFQEGRLFDNCYLSDQVCRVFEVLEALTGHQGLSARRIRSSVIHHWLKQYHLREVQYMAGHRCVSSTVAYRRHDQEELREQVNKHHPLG